MNPFPYSDDNKRYQTYSYYLRHRFGSKVSRISLNAGMSCPNLDGTKGTGGCTYCSSSGSGEFAGKPSQTITQQFSEVADRMAEKWDTQKHIAYFQARTNTYASLERLRALYEEALACPGVVGLSIATRPDCLPEDVCDLLGELAQKTYLTVELGLQSIWDETGRRINRCHTYDDFLLGYEKLHRRGVPVGVHIINGLPGETPDMMCKTAQELSKLNLHLVKIHLLHVLKGTRLAEEYAQGQFDLLTKEDYVDIVCNQLEQFPQEFVLGRLTGDGAPDSLIGPTWSKKKLCVLNAVDQELMRRDSWQGKYFHKSNE